MTANLPADRHAIGNQLIAGLADADFEILRPHLRRVVLTQHDRLIRPDAPTEHVYFPETGMVSLILSLEDGTIVEVGLVGNEGLVGVLAGLGASRISGEAIVQMPGSALSLSTEVLRREVGICHSLREMLLTYVQALFAQITQSAACNGRHTLPQRTARWLLMANDCAATEEIKLTHEFLSMMIRVRRPGITDALGHLKLAGIIDTARGTIVIRDRKRLEEIACECYRTVKAEYQRLLVRGRQRHASRSDMTGDPQPLSRARARAASPSRS